VRRGTALDHALRSTTHVQCSSALAQEPQGASGQNPLPSPGTELKRGPSQCSQPSRGGSTSHCAKKKSVRADSSSLDLDLELVALFNYANEDAFYTKVLPARGARGPGMNRLAKEMGERCDGGEGMPATGCAQRLVMSGYELG
jgi:hypothetical protein